MCNAGQMAVVGSLIAAERFVLTKALVVFVPDLTIQNVLLKTDVQSESVHLEFLLLFLLEEETEVF